MAKEILIAAVYGVSRSLDAFNIAYGFPAILALTVSGAVSAGFVPLYVEWRARSSMEAEQKFQSLLWGSAAVFLVVSLLCLLLAPSLYPLFGYGLSREHQAEVIRIGRYLTLFLFMELLCILPSGYLHARKAFFHLHVLPIIPSVVVILCLFCWPSKTIDILVLGVAFGSLLKCCYGLGALRGYGVRFGWTVQWDREAARRLMSLVLPLLGSELIANVNIFIDQVMATELSEGAVSVLRYAYRVNDIPLQIVILALSKAILPYVSELAVQRDQHGLREMFFVVLTAVAVISFPMASVFALHAEEIVRILFMRGAFGEESVPVTAKTLVFYAIGLFFYSYSFINSSFFIALQEMRWLFIMGCVSVVLNVLFNFVGMRFLGVSGIALSTSATLLVVCSVFLKLLQWKLAIDGFRRIFRTIFVIGAATGFLIMTALAVRRVSWLTSWSYWGNFVAHLLLEGLVFLAVLYIFRTPDVDRLVHLLVKAARVSTRSQK
ncbi:murein biosynthesis integral membrane protein MurJ [Desulfosoma sp.]